MAGNFLTLEEELACGKVLKRFRTGQATKEEYETALCILWENNKKAVYKLVHSFFRWYKMNGFYLLEDAISDATLEFLRFCREKYDPDRGYKVMTGATHWIKKALRAQAGKSRPVELKESGEYKYIQISKAIRDYEEREEETCSLSQFLQIQFPKMTKRDKIQLLSLHQGVTALDFPVCSETGISVGDFISDPKSQQDFDTIEYRESIVSLLRLLQPIEREALCIKYELWNLSSYDSRESFQRRNQISQKEFQKLTTKAIQKIRKGQHQYGKTTFHQNYSKKFLPNRIF